MPTCHKKALFELILYYHHPTCLRNAPKPLALIFQLRKNVTIKRLRYLSIPAQRNRDTEINFIQLNIRKWWRWLTTATYPMQTYFKSRKLSIYSGVSYLSSVLNLHGLLQSDPIRYFNPNWSLDSIEQSNPRRKRQIRGIRFFRLMDVWIGSSKR